MRASTKRIASILLATTLFIASLVLYSSFISDEYDTVQRLRGEIVSRTELVGDQEAAVRQVQQLIAEFQGITRLKETLNLSLPARENLPQALGQIQGIAAANNLTLQSLGVELLPFRVPPTGAIGGLAKGIGTLRVNFRLLGTHESFRAFLTTIETNVRVFDLFRVDITHGGQPNQNLYIYNLAVDTYYQQN